MSLLLKSNLDIENFDTHLLDIGVAELELAVEECSEILEAAKKEEKIILIKVCCFNMGTVSCIFNLIFFFACNQNSTC